MRYIFFQHKRLHSEFLFRFCIRVMYFCPSTFAKGFAPSIIRPEMIYITYTPFNEQNKTVLNPLYLKFACRQQKN